MRLLDGGTATMVDLHALPGVGPMWDLSLDATHTFAVGDMRVVVHNCGSPQADGSGNTPLYRGINESEYDSVESSGFQSYGHSPSQGGKYFSYSQGGATHFAETPFNQGHIWTITGTSVPQSAIDQALAAGVDHAFEFNDVGGANASIWFSDEELDAHIYPNMSPIEVLDQFINEK